MAAAYDAGAANLPFAALRGYIAANRDKISTTQTLLQSLDAATPINLGSTLFAPRFPRIY